MRKLTRVMLAAAMVVGIGIVSLPAATVSAVNVFDQCASNPDNPVCKSQGDDASSMIQIVINTLLYVLGIIAVLMIIVGGIRYTTSSGDPGSLKTARDTIIYSVVGLVVAILAYAIVNLVVGRFITG